MQSAYLTMSWSSRGTYEHLPVQTTPPSLTSDGSLRGSKGNAVRAATLEAAAAPATVSGEPDRPRHDHWETGKVGEQAATREPGDIPSHVRPNSGGALLMTTLL